MKSLADIKRRIVPGAILECLSNTYRPELSGRRRIAEKVQGNGFFWKHADALNESRSWTQYPAAKAIRIINDDTFDLMLDRQGSDGPDYVRLRFVSAA